MKGKMEYDTDTGWDMNPGAGGLWSATLSVRLPRRLTSEFIIIIISSSSSSSSSSR